MCLIESTLTRKTSSELIDDRTAAPTEETPESVTEVFATPAAVTVPAEVLA